MMSILLKSALGLFTTFFGFFYIRDEIRNRKTFSDKPWPALAGTGFLTNMLDTLGIGSFAQQTAIFKFFKLVDDRLIPGTMNVGNTIPTVTQAFIFMTAVKVDPVTLVAMSRDFATFAGVPAAGGRPPREVATRLRPGVASRRPEG